MGEHSVLEHAGPWAALLEIASGGYSSAVSRRRLCTGDDGPARPRCVGEGSGVAHSWPALDADRRLPLIVGSAMIATAIR